MVAGLALSFAAPSFAQPTTSENPQAKAAERTQHILRGAGNARAQAVPRGVSAREQAIRECSALQQTYSQPTWGEKEAYVYRACMTEHDQPE
jgi:hypothetical protein